MLLLGVAALVPYFYRMLQHLCHASAESCSTFVIFRLSVEALVHASTEFYSTSAILLLCMLLLSIAALMLCFY